MTTKKAEECRKPAGGIFFFASLLSLIFLGALNSASLPFIFERSGILPLFYMLLATTTGAVAAFFTIRGRPAVFIHEFKHSLVSHFAGNRPKAMKVKSRSGHFTYEYTKSTAHFNAFISLAPYFVPLFTIPAIGVGYLFWRNDHLIVVAIAGLAYGMDLQLNWRDVSPIQTDILYIRGGYRVGLTYIIAMNITILSFVLAWVIGGPIGPLRLIERGALTIASLFQSP